MKRRKGKTRGKRVDSHLSPSAKLAELMARKTLRRIKSLKLTVYPVPGPEKLALYDSWVICRQNPALVRATGRVAGPNDPTRWWLPVVWSQVDWRLVYWLQVTESKLAGRHWQGSLCRPCQLKITCILAGRDHELEFDCVAQRSTLVHIYRDRKTSDR